MLDDTLSALDVHTEAVVEEALRRVLHSVTGIVVAHRASTVLLADKVALLGDGTITHVGTHAGCSPVPQYRYLAADDELDDGAERCAWQDDEDAKQRLARPTRSRRPPTRPATPGPEFRRRRPTADDRDRHHQVDLPEDPDEAAGWRGRFKDSATTTCRSTRPAAPP